VDAAALPVDVRARERRGFSPSESAPERDEQEGKPAGLEGAAVIATDAVISVATSIIKISVFGLAGVVTAQVLAFALLIGAIAIPGAFLARTFVERMPVHIHTAILDVAVIAGGLVMISAAMGH